MRPVPPHYRHPRRQIHREIGQHLPVGHPGPGAPADDAARARRRRRPEYCRLRVRLPRFAAGRPRRDPVESQGPPGSEPRPVRAGRERRPGGDRRLGHANGRPDRPDEIRRRVRHVVRQGPGRGPLRRRLQTHEPCGDRKERRRAAGRRRRPRRLLVDPAAPVRPHLLGLHDPGALPVQCAGIPGPRRARLGDVALLRLRRRLQGAGRHGRIERLGRRQPAPRTGQTAAGFRDAGRRPEYAPVLGPAGPAGAQRRKR
jgi:hypothetical protein